MNVSDCAALAQAIAAFLTFGAAAVAVWATLRAPERAARIAENLRVQSEKAENLRREKYAIFYAMMNWRGSNLTSVESLKAVNLIPVIFENNEKIISAQKIFVERALNPQSTGTPDAYLELLVEIILDLGLSKHITKEKLNYGYFPLASVHVL